MFDSIESIDALGAVAGTWGVLMAVSPLLQIGFALWIAYGIALGSIPLIVPNSVALMVGFVTISIAWAYRNGRAAVSEA